MENILMNKHYFDLIHNIPVSMAIFDKDMKYIVYSKKWLQDYNLDEDTQLIGKLHYDVFPNTPLNWIALHEDALKGKTSSAKKDIYRDLNDSIKYINWEIKPWFENNNTIGGVIITTEDITDSVELSKKVNELKSQIEETKKKEEINSLINQELNATKEKLQNKQIELEMQNQELQEKEQDLLIMAEEHKEIFENAPNPYVVINENLEIVKFNKIADTEFKINETHKNFISSLIEKESYFAFFNHLKNASYNKEPIILKVITSDKIIKNYKLTIVEHPIDKNLFLLVFINIDNELIMIEQTKLASIGEMFSNITHQWRQPLNVISMGVSELIFYYKNNIEVTEEKSMISLNNIQRQVYHLNDTINTFANFMKNDRCLLKISYQEIINKTLTILNPSLKTNEIKIIKNMPEEDIYIKSVTGELEQVIINIVNNAIDVFIERNITNKELIFDLSYEKQKVILKIQDNAGGIPKEVLPYIFEAHFSTKKQKNGMGIGLHMCKRIVNESLNGELYADNSKNGANFYIVL